MLWPSRYASSTLGYMAGLGLASTMLDAAFGIDITRQWVRAQAGLAPQLPHGGDPLTPPRLAGWALVAPRPGTGRTVPRRPDDPWIAHASTTVRPGSRMGEATSSVDAAAAFVVTGVDPSEVDERLASCVRRFTDGWTVDAP